MRLPFFGLLTTRSPLDGLVKHFKKIKECTDIVKESMECYVAGGACREFMELAKQVDEVENHADTIKRNIRNQMPRRLFMPVDKTLFLNYTKAQDNILDDAQEAMQWLAMRRVNIPEKFQKEIIDLIDDVTTATSMLGPALTATIRLIYMQHVDREGTKGQYQAVRAQRHKIFKAKNALVSEIYNSDMDFKDIYQLIHFVERLDAMSHNAENCADILRAMIVR